MRGSRSGADLFKVCVILLVNEMRFILYKEK